MVEDQQSIKTILSFGAKSVDPGILEQLLTGREKNAEYLFNVLDGIVHHGNNQQVLVIGQRGMGKTHLLRLLYHRCQEFIKTGRLVVAYFSEEEYGVSDYFDFLTRVLYAFIRWNLDDLPFLEENLGKLQNAPVSEQVFMLEDIIREYISDRPLLILAENFADLLNGMGSGEQGKLRAWIYANKRVSIIATSQALSDDFDKEDRPFYGFFQLYYLKSLSYKESYNFLISLARLEGRKEVVEHIKTKGKAQVRAVYDLVKGNHRLLVTFYEFLKNDTLAKLSNHFIKTVNDLKPYYETYIRYLPPQQQKILRYIALSRKPQPGAIISKNCFIDPKSLSKQLSELTRKNLIEVIQDKVDRRNKLYDINEPLLRISIEVGEHKEGITALFIDFLALFYDEEELEGRKVKISTFLLGCDNLFEKRNFQYEIQAIEKAIDLQRHDPFNAIFAAAFGLLRGGDPEAAIKFLETNKSALDGQAYLLILTMLQMAGGVFDQAVINFARLEAVNIQANNLYYYWGVALLNLAGEDRDNEKELLIESIGKFRLSDKNREPVETLEGRWGIAIGRLATTTNEKGLFIESIDKLRIAMKKNPHDLQACSMLAALECRLSIDEKDISYAVAGFKNVREVVQASPESTELIKIVVATAMLWFNAMENDVSKFRELFDAMKLNITTDGDAEWRYFSSNPKLYFFEMFSLTLESGLRGAPLFSSGTIIDWINEILAYDPPSLKKDKLLMLEDAVGKLMTVFPEMAISLTYIKVFEEHFLNGNPNAVYELPKEQRLFFEKNILKE